MSKAFVTPEGLFLDEVLAEISRARVKFPTNEDRLAALHEESGEVAKALLAVKYGTGDWGALFRECVQLAAMSARLALEGDPSIALPPEPGAALPPEVLATGSDGRRLIDLSVEEPGQREH